MAQRHPVERLRQLSPARRQGDARDSRGPGHVCQFTRGVGAAAAVGPASTNMITTITNLTMQTVGTWAACGVDRSHQGGRTAGGGAAAAA